MKENIVSSLPPDSTELPQTRLNLAICGKVPSRLFSLNFQPMGKKRICLASFSDSLSFPTNFEAPWPFLIFSMLKKVIGRRF